MRKKAPIVVIGGGPAGMMAALSCAEQGLSTILIEKNTRLGKKMRIAGKGRCNVTNACDLNTLINNMPGGGKFLYSAFASLMPADVMTLFEDSGVPLKIERGQRVFPVSDKSDDIVSCLERKLRNAGVAVHFHEHVTSIDVADGAIRGVRCGDRFIPASAVVMACGGASYPLTGSDGSGYRLVSEIGHKIVPLSPSLVPLEVSEPYAAEMEGLSLRNAEISVYDQQKLLAKDFGELMFTDFGLSGPVILTVSRACGRHFLESPTTPLSLRIDLKPALSHEVLDLRLRRDFEQYSKRKYSTILEELLPKKMIPPFVVLSNIDPWKQGHQLNREDRKTILALLKAFPFTITRCRPMEEAVVTCGGVLLKEIDPKTMASKKIEGLFFAGEVMDIDGYTGGFNIQAALATGYRAGFGVAEYDRKGNQ